VTGVLVSLLELGGGLLVVLGLATRVVVALFGATMVGAALLVHLPNGFYAQNGGWELVGLLAALCVALLVSGAGRYSVDAVIADRRRASRAQAASASVAEPERARV
jgi:putative oxidoreductase